MEHLSAVPMKQSYAEITSWSKILMKGSTLSDQVNYNEYTFDTGKWEETIKKYFHK